MLRTIFTPDSNCINIPIPEKYIGVELEILVFPISEVSALDKKNKESIVDASFGGWADMDKSTEKICSEIRQSRTFRNRELL